MPLMIVCPDLLVGVRCGTTGLRAASFCRPTPSFSTSTLVFGSIAIEMTGSGKIIFSRRIGLLLVAERVAGARVAEADGRVDVAGVGLGELLALVGVHAQDAADALALVARRVEHHRAARDLARVDAEEREVAVRVVDDLERERGERLVVGGLALDLRLVLLVRVDALDRRDVDAATAGS